MARQHSLPYQFPPIGLLAPAADAAGRTSSYRTLKGALKAWVVCRVNQGAAAQVTFTPLQAQDVSGTNSKAINAVPIYLVNAIATSDKLVPQTAAANFQADASLADKFVIFEIMPEVALDEANGFKTIAVQTSASNAANITESHLVVWQRYEGQDVISTYAN